MKRLWTVLCAALIAGVLIFWCFLTFQTQMEAYIQADMQEQIEAILENNIVSVRNELNYLEHMTVSASHMLGNADIQTEEDILRILRDYAEASDIVRTLFVTLDGHAYTSYAGYLGQSESSTSIDGIPLSEITSPVFSQPHYSEGQDEVIFGVVAPVTLAGRKGVLVSSYNISKFSTILGSGLIDGAASVGIVNSKGNVINGKSREEFMRNIFDAMEGISFESSSVNEMRRNFADGVSGFCIYNSNNVTRYCAYGSTGLNDWNVIVMVTEEALRSKLVFPERYGFQLMMELVVIMLGLLAVVVTSSMSEQKKVQATLRQAAMMDGLTGCLNRAAFEKMVSQRLPSAPEAVLLLIDVDDFKRINDEFGHPFGDQVLRACADRLTELFGSEGAVGRIGGDEFAVFLEGKMDMAQAAEKIDDMNRDFYVETKAGARQKVFTSVGFARAEAETNTFLSLYNQADGALYRAKQSGKGCLES